MSSLLKPISGFPEWLPHEQRFFEGWKHIIVRHFQAYGFIPMDTPSVERLETLVAKGGDDHEIYGVVRAAEQNASKIELALRYDLTLPLARYVAQHQGQLVFPYRRYHMAPVWRGERPQEGRFRQFIQCDIDIIGRETLSPLYDAEVIAIMWELLHKLEISPVRVLLNHKKIPLAWIQKAGISQEAEALRLMDKRGKIEDSAILEGLGALGAHPSALGLLEGLMQNNASWEALMAILLRSDLGEGCQEGLREITTLLATLHHMGVPQEGVVVDPLLVRGLTYYTGPLYEFVLPEHRGMGSICAGGRYGHLAESFSKKAFPGVGISLGLTRLFSAMKSRAPLRSTPADCLITVQEPDALPYYLAVARLLRQANLYTEVYLNGDSLKTQLHYANRLGFSWVLMANQEEIANHQVTLKHMKTGLQHRVKQEEAASYLLGQATTYAKLECEGGGA